MTLVAGPERMAIIDSVQATMAVIEGHAEHVMDAVGARGPAVARRAARRARTAAAARRRPLLVLFEKLLGLEMKMKQYELGRASATRSSTPAASRRSTASGRAPARSPRSARSRRRSSGSSAPRAARPRSPADRPALERSLVTTLDRGLRTYVRWYTSYRT